MLRRPPLRYGLLEWAALRAAHSLRSKHQKNVFCSGFCAFWAPPDVFGPTQNFEKSEIFRTIFGPRDPHRPASGWWYPTHSPAGPQNLKIWRFVVVIVCFGAPPTFLDRPKIFQFFEIFAPEHPTGGEEREFSESFGVQSAPVKVGKKNRKFFAQWIHWCFLRKHIPKNFFRRSRCFWHLNAILLSDGTLSLS